jgi:Ca2+-transporting ATPase
MEVAAATTASASWRRDRRGPAAESVRRLAEVAVLAGLPEPIDPMEQALKRFLAAHGASPPTAKRELVLRKGPAAGVLAVRQVWRWPDGRMFLAAKGAPETIVALCALAGADRERVLDEARRLAAEGLRVLGVACAEGRADPGALTEARLGYLGLVGFEDPVRESAPAAVAEFRRAGVRVVMITGDLPETARAIAAQAGLDSGRVLVGAEIGRLDDRALREAVKSCDVFARILPADKLRIVEALKANGEVVGMTGDGVNDAPSLAAAHIGVAMGGRGSDVAREASSIVLLDDDFGALAETVRLGRRIYDNLRKAMGYILSVHVPIAGMALLLPLAGGPLILTPALIAILELIIDPACSIVFEAEPAEKNVMDRPPRDPRASLLDRRLIGLGAAEGLVAFFVVAVVYASVAGRADEEIRTVVFGALALVNVGLIFAHRSFAPTARAAFAAFNPRLGLGLVVVAAAFLAIFGLPDARALFELAPLSAGDLLLCAGAALAFMTASFSLKRLFRRRA